MNAMEKFNRCGLQGFVGENQIKDNTQIRKDTWKKSDADS